MALSNSKSISKLKLGLLLKATREAYGIQQKDMALMLQYSGATFISQIEKGKVPVPPQRAAEFAHHYTGGSEIEALKLTLMILRLSQETVWHTWMASACAVYGKSVNALTDSTDKMIRNKLLEYGIEF